MGYEPEKFSVMGENDKPFFPGSQAAIDMLESITPADKAQAVPYVLLWEIDTTTGKAMHANSDGTPKRPISVIYTEPPKFGARLDNPDERFRERPPVSLERIAIKTQNPRGTILYSELDLSFIVHKPDIVFDEHIREDGSHVGEGDSWSSFVTPGQAFALEYGWSASNGVKNGILNGDGYSDKTKGVLIPGRKQIRFVVTRYKFDIQQDMSIKFMIHAFEMGEFNLRQAFLAPAEDDGKDHTPRTKKPVDPYADDRRGLQLLLKKFQDRVAGSSKVEKSQKKGGVQVPFGLLFDVIFAEQIEKAFKDLGFTLGGLFMGRFNTRAGKPAPKYSSGSSVSNQPISDFSFPLDDIEKIFRDLMSQGTRLTVYNFIEPFLRLFSNTSMWDELGIDPMSVTRPQIAIKSSSRKTRDGKIEVFFYIFDMNREFTKFTPDDSKKLPRQAASRADVRKIVTEAGVPFISFVKANSFVIQPTFETIQDEQMGSIFINRYFGDKHVNRDQKVNSPDVAGKENRAPAAQQIYSPVLKGKIAMLGNFVLDTFNLVWLDFGIKRWDGPFNVYEMENIIERGAFTTTISVFSAGTDPLNSQGR